MGLFKKSKTPTKMFVSHLSPPKTKGFGFEKQGKGLDIPSIREAVTDKITEIAPELVQEGFKLLSSTIAGFTEDYTNDTILFKNIDGDISNPIFVPRHITVVRADFTEEDICRDGYGENSRCDELQDKRLHIELDIVQSHDRENFFFQPTKYYYIGIDNRGKKIDEVNIYFAFVEASENISDYKNLDFKEAVSFRDLNNNREYSFKRSDGSYDTTFQSPWINSEHSKRGAYTIVLKIQEKRYSKPFATTINKVYQKHEEDLKKRISQELKKQLYRLSKNEKIDV
ncbi:MAG: hypothetical protein GXO60_04305 [Epsilonproteobacteria bacterium]|nr:hypothetical protein [Campylobacterota bacterium]